MLSPAKARLGILFGLALLVLTSAPARATVIVEDPTLTSSIPGIATFQTTGALMGGMTVRAIFDNGLDEMVSWVAGVGDSGGAFGSDWSLTVDGDTFLTDWNLTNNTGGGLLSLVLDGAPGLTVFDRTFGDIFGTPGSARGLDFAESPTVSGTAVYSVQVAIGMNLPVGDLWQMLSVRFDEAISEDFSFVQDTDNDIRRPPITTPEPSTLALLGAALAFVGIFRRRRE